MPMFRQCSVYVLSMFCQRSVYLPSVPALFWRCSVYVQLFSVFFLVLSMICLCSVFWVFPRCLEKANFFAVRVQKGFQGHTSAPPPQQSPPPADRTGATHTTPDPTSSLTCLFLPPPCFDFVFVVF